MYLILEILERIQLLRLPEDVIAKTTEAFAEMPVCSSRDNVSNCKDTGERDYRNTGEKNNENIKEKHIEKHFT